MAFQGRSIQASVELDLAPLELSITKANEMLGKLGGAFEFKKEPLVQLEQYMGKVRDIFKMVSDEALKINEAFNNIQGLKTFIENLETLKAKMETIANDVDKINQAILKENESATQFAETEQRINGIMDNGLASLQKENQLINNSLKYLAEQEQLERQRVALLNEVNWANEQAMNILMGKATTISEIVAEEERELTLLREVASANEQSLAVLTGRATSVTEILAMTDEELALLREELALEEEILGIEKQQTGEIGKQNAERMTGAKATKGNQLDSMSYLPRRIGSMALTMWGFNELMDVYDKTMGHINAESQKDYFAKRMGMDAKATDDFTKSLERMQNGWTDATGKFHKGYQKLDMTVVGANALETASKYKVQQDSLGDLTEVMAIYGSEFVKQGRSQEDSILAVNDALDGELRRLKEVGIGKEELEATGLWNGDESDKSGMLKALLQIAEERGYDQTAKDITNLSDAITTLEVKLSIDLARAFGIVEPLLRDVMSNFVTMLEVIEQLCTWIGKFATDFAKMTGLMDENGKGTKLGNFLETWASWFITLGITALGLYKILKPLLGMFGKLKDIGGGIGKGAEDVATTGGTVAKDIEKGGFKSEFKKLGRNLGIMARVFIEVAIGLVMAWALMEEAMILIARIGDDYEKMKPSFDKGAKFLKEYGIYILAVGGAMAVLLQYTDKLPQTDWKSQAKAFGKLMIGLAEAMVLIGEAIALLIIPLGAIALLGWMSDQLDPNMIQKGNEVIGMYADALDYIASNDNIGYFIIGLTVASAVLGFTADTVGVGLAIGIASALLLIAEAIVMLIAPLKAIEILGGMASSLDATAIQQGANAIKIVGDCLQALEPAVRNLLAVDFEVLGIGLVEKGNQIVNGKSGLKSLTDEILPSLIQFVQDVADLTIPTDTDITGKVTAITQMANQISPLFTAMQTLNNAMGTSGVMGKTSTWLGGVMDAHMGTGLKPQLDKLYNDIKDVMEFANNLGNLGSVETANTTAVTQTSSAITQLKTKLTQFVSTISSYATKVESASKTLGNALPNGFKSGASTFGSTVISVLASGIAQVQARYNTMNSGGKALGQKLVDGFKNHKPSLKTVTSREISYALTELDNAKDDFYTKGKALGSELTRGYEDGADIHSPGLIARTTVRELRYTMDALDTGKKMMYQGGVALGQALTNGYNSYGNLRTDVGVLASKGVSNEQLQANAKNTQLNGNQKGQTPQLTQTNINIDMSNSTVIGVQDLDNKIRQAVEKAIVSINSPNGAIGY